MVALEGGEPGVEVQEPAAATAAQALEVAGD